MYRNTMLKPLSHFKYPILFLITILLIVSDLQAQRGRNRGRQVFKAYPAFGTTGAQLEGDELRGFKKWGITAGVGAMLSLDRDNMWHASIEADFSQRGAQNKTHDPYRLLDFTMNYVDRPLTIHFTDP